MYCGMPKDTSRAEATLNSEKIKPIALAIIELRLSKDISQSVSQAVRQSVSQAVSQSVSQVVSQSENSPFSHKG